MDTASFDDLLKLDIRVGRVVTAEPLTGARKPAYALTIDLGEQIGSKSSSAQITDLYRAEDIIGRLVLCVVNLMPMRVAGFKSEVLTLGVYASGGVALIVPDDRGSVKPGDRLG